MKVEHTNQIDASLETVWRVSVDVENWPEWHPTMSEITLLDSADFAVGGQAKIKQTGLPEATWQVMSLTEHKAFTWGTTIRGIKMIAKHWMESAENGVVSTVSIEGEGWFTRFLWPLAKGQLAKAIADENDALKVFCESIDP